MTQTKTGSPSYLLSLSNMLDLIRYTSVHSSSLLTFNAYNILASEHAASRIFLKFSSVEVITRGERTNNWEEGTNMRQQSTTSNEFVAVVTFPWQYILISSYSHIMFYVVCVLLLRVHCRKALRHNTHL